MKRSGSGSERFRRNMPNRSAKTALRLMINGIWTGCDINLRLKSTGCGGTWIVTNHLIRRCAPNHAVVYRKRPCLRITDIPENSGKARFQHQYPDSCGGLHPVVPCHMYPLQPTRYGIVYHPERHRRNLFGVSFDLCHSLTSQGGVRCFQTTGAA